MSFLTEVTTGMKNLFLQKDKTPVPEWANPQIVELNEEIERVKGLLNVARNNFNAVTDPDALEYYIYLQKAYEVRYDMLVRRLKEVHDTLSG